MKKHILILILLSVWCAGEIRAQNNITGLWKTHNGQYLIKVDKLGDIVTGRIVWLENENDKQGKPLLDEHNPNAKMRNLPLKGLKIIDDMEFNASLNQWEKGMMYWPENGISYHCNIKAEKDKLILTYWQKDNDDKKTMTWNRKE